MKRITLLQLAALLAMGLAAVAARGEEPSDRSAIEQLFQQGQSAFDAGLAARASDTAAARDSFEKAAAHWQAIVDEHAIHNGRLLYNIGNAHLLAGRVGPAILSYRKAQRYIAGDPHLVSNLQQARRRVMTYIEPEATTRVADALLFWHHGWSGRTRLSLLTALSGFAWLWGLARLSSRGAAWPRWPALAAGALAFVLAGSLAVEHVASGDHLEGVVMRDVAGRKGPSEVGYEPSFTEPLAEGVEFAVSEDRGDWMLVRLADERETWLPRTAVGLVE